ncbi:MAG: DNA gyrase subunit A [Halanaerobium sp. 4-GBenrich]|uniref:DNA gyrase subunit A n=1 Tax=Halanaerobium congolense TaxID=54121 RepID=A0A1G6IIX0_9FIRM|nr:DNA gyrase subunit A [Halanaerobium congolense]ODS50167.1 MAG: DNA gyrase subunit A [Halanaerobium sp. 4-GBenrich]PUU92342.1 MAG: DNA gyrase subunit A [Halanaerobium sp.]PTX15957.1 DNA gyrase subunit A [Halanaerobium congolense]PXV64550.1 DNA gyrase subunit A [Halanaerobium congolense]TDP12279.1 DNA gyrase subunit A [Halanaerobium congolense]
MEQKAARVKKIDIDQEMRTSYLDYSMSVIVGRALPDVRDGLKPVHRRILYALNDLGMTHTKPHKKSARIVGEVLGKYHPHGDTAVYDTMVRMAQNFSYRYMLVDGHGNFGSIDGDSAAAMRYTEARMAPIASEMMTDINKETVDFIPNFDESLKEPQVLPARFPNLLVNGASGIAVGMSTSIPPHNLGEVIDGVIKLINNPEVTTKELMGTIKGPDFPTGGQIMGRGSIYKAYKNGRGKLTVRAKTRVEDLSTNRKQIIVDELPYQVNKARLIKKIADLVKDEKLEAISDIRDESDRDGMRIVIELKREATPQVVLNQLFKHSRLQVTFSVIMIALVDKEPKVLSLKEILEHYLEHQKEVISRRTKYDLDKALDRAHILEGYRIALANIDEIVEMIKNADEVDTARINLMENYNLSETQANAILRMRLQSLTGLERNKIETEYADLQEKITYYRSVLADELKLLEIVENEILEIKKKYNDERRTSIMNRATDLELEDLIEEEQIVVTMTNQGYIKRMPLDLYRSQRRGGKGVIGISTKEEDYVENIFTTTTHYQFLFFTNQGRVYRLKGYQIPETGRQARGTAIVNLLELEENEKINTVIPVKEFPEDAYLIMATKNGLIKKTALDEYDTNYTGLIAINLRENDELIGVRIINKDENIFLITKNAKAIHFSENDVRAVGRNSYGVKGINLENEDQVIDMGIDSAGEELLVITENGYGKRTPISKYRIQNRGGKGILTANITDKNGKLAAARIVEAGLEMMVITQNGIIIRVDVDEISTTGRNTIGVKIINVGEEDEVVSLARINDEIVEEDEENEDEKEDLTPEEKAKVRFDKIVEKIDKEEAEKALAEEKTKSEAEKDIEADNID